MDPRGEDDAIYVSVTTNSLGSSRCEVNLIIRSTIKVTIYSREPILKVKDGKSVRFNCSVLGHPVDGVHWVHDLRVIQVADNSLIRRDNHNLINGYTDRQQNKMVHQLDYPLKLNRLTRSNAGMYQCLAWNRFESSQASIQLAFEGKKLNLIQFGMIRNISSSMMIRINCVSLIQFPQMSLQCLLILLKRSSYRLETRFH